MKATGYSGTPLIKKLGIQENQVIRLLNPPANYFALLNELPGTAVFRKTKAGKKDFIHWFVTNQSELTANISAVRSQLNPTGMLWISWPKKSSNVATDVTEDVIRE